MVAALGHPLYGAKGCGGWLLLFPSGRALPHARLGVRGVELGTPAAVTAPSELVSVVIWGAVLLDLWRSASTRVRCWAPSAPGHRGAGAGVAHRPPARWRWSPRSGARGSGFTPRWRCSVLAALVLQLRGRGDVSPAGAPAQGEASGTIYYGALAGDARRLSYRTLTWASRSSPPGSCWARSGRARPGERARLRPARALPPSSCAGVRGHPRRAGGGTLAGAPRRYLAIAGFCALLLTLGAGVLLRGVTCS